MSDSRTTRIASESGSNSASRFAQIPSVNEVVDSPALSDWSQRLPRGVMVQAARAVLEAYRSRLAAGVPDGTPDAQRFAQEVCRILDTAERPHTRPVINATGIILHTNLGRAPLAEEAVEALVSAARRYVGLELDLESGRRGRRGADVRKLLCGITGAESAAVVNNNAAATLITLATVAVGRRIIVSRGELIEIGGSFRLPEIMAASGGILHEVGTTNKTRLSDYETAIDESTAALLKVHTSNSRIEGFTESVPIAALADLGHRRDLAVIDDIGSGALVADGRYALGGEPNAAASLEHADLVLFSGDKLLGGPQAGIILGTGSWIERIEANPLYRAVRVDKLTLAALAATLRLHRDEQLARRRIPILAMANTSIAQLTARAEHIAQQLEALEALEVRISRERAYLGGGSLPLNALESVALSIRAESLTDHQLADRLRRAAPPVMARARDGRVLLDLRTVFEDQDAELAAAIRSATER